MTDREKALEAALAQIDKQFGKGSVMRLGDQTQAPVEVIPTGSVAMDVALGIGGLPRGRVVEIYGPESSGKTTLALHAVANAQRNGGIAAFIDAEHALDPVYAQKLGVDIDSVCGGRAICGRCQVEVGAGSFAKHGITVITPAAGDKFDPSEHEAMFEAAVPGTIQGEIIQVMDNGFRLHDRLLRPAKVGVSSTPAS